MISFSSCRRFIAFFTVTAFMLTQTISPFPSAFAAPVSLRPEVGLAQSFNLSIPADLGTIQYRVSGNGPALVHLQTAHGNYEAQKKIEAMLKYLKDRFGFKVVLLEGSAFKLSPELLNFFPHYPENTKAANDELTKKAVVKGPELFLLETPDAEGYGIENLYAYRENIEAFRSVLKEREKSESFVEAMNQQIDRLTAPYLNKNLRNFVKRLEAFEKNQVPFDTRLSELKSAAAGTLKLDLTQAGYQLEWPMLVRLYKLQALAKKMNTEMFEKEKPAFLKALKGIPQDLYSRVEKLLSGPITGADADGGVLFEEVTRYLPETFKSSLYPQVTAFIAHGILQSEMKSDLLMLELEKLTDLIADRMADTPEAKQVLGLLKDYRLLEKLFALELTPADYEKLLSRSQELEPQKMAERFLALNVSKRVKDVSFSLNEVSVLFQKAMEFYRGAKERDGFMLQAITEKMAELKADKAVVVTGGFHADPFRQFFTERQYQYALVSPKISSDKGRDAYLSIILENETGKVKTSTIETAPAASIPSELAALNVGENFFLGEVMPSVLNAGEGNRGLLEDFNRSPFALAWGMSARLGSLNGTRGVRLDASENGAFAQVLSAQKAGSQFYPFSGSAVIVREVPVVGQPIAAPKLKGMGGDDDDDDKRSESRTVSEVPEFNPDDARSAAGERQQSLREREGFKAPQNESLFAVNQITQFNAEDLLLDFIDLLKKNFQALPFQDIAGFITWLGLDVPKGDFIASLEMMSTVEKQLTFLISSVRPKFSKKDNPLLIEIARRLGKMYAFRGESREDLLSALEILANYLDSAPEMNRVSLDSNGRIKAYSGSEEAAVSIAGIAGLFSLIQKGQSVTFDRQVFNVAYRQELLKVLERFPQMSRFLELAQNYYQAIREGEIQIAVDQREGYILKSVTIELVSVSKRMGKRVNASVLSDFELSKANAFYEIAALYETHLSDMTARERQLFEGHLVDLRTLISRILKLRPENRSLVPATIYEVAPSGYYMNAAVNQPSMNGSQYTFEQALSFALAEVGGKESDITAVRLDSKQLISPADANYAEMKATRLQPGTLLTISFKNGGQISKPAKKVSDFPITAKQLLDEILKPLKDGGDSFMDVIADSQSEMSVTYSHRMGWGYIPALIFGGGEIPSEQYEIRIQIGVPKDRVLESSQVNDFMSKLEAAFPHHKVVKSEMPASNTRNYFALSLTPRAEMRANDKSPRLGLIVLGSLGLAAGLLAVASILSQTKDAEQEKPAPSPVVEQKERNVSFSVQNLADTKSRSEMRQDTGTAEDLQVQRIDTRLSVIQRTIEGLNQEMNHSSRDRIKNLRERIKQLTGEANRLGEERSALRREMRQDTGTAVLRQKDMKRSLNTASSDVVLGRDTYQMTVEKVLTQTALGPQEIGTVKISRKITGDQKPFQAERSITLSTLVSSADALETISRYLKAALPGKNIAPSSVGETLSRMADSPFTFETKPALLNQATVVVSPSALVYGAGIPAVEVNLNVPHHEISLSEFEAIVRSVLTHQDLHEGNLTALRDAAQFAAEELETGNAAKQAGINSGMEKNARPELRMTWNEVHNRLKNTEFYLTLMQNLRVEMELGNGETAVFSSVDVDGRIQLIPSNDNAEIWEHNPAMRNAVERIVVKATVQTARLSEAQNLLALDVQHFPDFSVAFSEPVKKGESTQVGMILTPRAESRRWQIVRTAVDELFRLVDEDRKIDQMTLDFGKRTLQVRRDVVWSPTEPFSPALQALADLLNTDRWVHMDPNVLRHSMAAQIQTEMALSKVSEIIGQFETGLKNATGSKPMTGLAWRDVSVIIGSQSQESGNRFRVNAIDILPSNSNLAKESKNVVSAETIFPVVNFWSEPALVLAEMRTMPVWADRALRPKKAEGVQGIKIEIAEAAAQKGWFSPAALENLKSWNHADYALYHEAINSDLTQAGEDLKNWGALNDAWYTKVAPGTAGQRGKLGVGTNKINLITQGLFFLQHAIAVADSRFNEIVKAQDPEFNPAKEKKAVVIGGDSRWGSFDPNTGGPGELNKLAALAHVLYGTKVYLFGEPVTTPEVAWATHQLEVKEPNVAIVSGLMDTASHNPPTDNGTKSYKPDGSQSTNAYADLMKIVLPEATASKLVGLKYKGISILENLDQAYEAALKAGDIVVLGEEAHEQFLQYEMQDGLHTSADGKFNPEKINLKDAKIVASALNGSGMKMLNAMMIRRGIDPKNITWIEGNPNPDFSEVNQNKPNPELPSARENALKKAVELNADIIVWMDPDADRPAVGAKKNPAKQSETIEDYELFNGNQQLAILTAYMLGELKAAAGEVSAKSESAMVKKAAQIVMQIQNIMMASTVVSGDMMKMIAREAGAVVAETLVGFKYIGDQIELRAKQIQAKSGVTERQWRRLSKTEKIELALKQGELYLFGGEESLGTDTGDGAHDKDAVSGLMWFIETFGRLRAQGRTMGEMLNSLYEQYGYFGEPFPMLEISRVHDEVEFDEERALEIIKAKEGASILNFFRNNPPAQIGGKEVLAVLDFDAQVAKNVKGQVLFTADSVSGVVNPATSGIPADFAEALSHIPVPATVENAKKPHFQGVYSFAHAPLKGEAKTEKLPKENFLLLLLADGSKVIIRPSGTEPKVKFYILGHGLYQDRVKVDQWIDTTSQELKKKAAEIARERFPQAFQPRPESREAESLLLKKAFELLTEAHKAVVNLHGEHLKRKFVDISVLIYQGRYNDAAKLTRDLKALAYLPDEESNLLDEAAGLLDQAALESGAYEYFSGRMTPAQQESLGYGRNYRGGTIPRFIDNSKERGLFLGLTEAIAVLGLMGKESEMPANISELQERMREWLLGEIQHQGTPTIQQMVLAFSEPGKKPLTVEMVRASLERMLDIVRVSSPKLGAAEMITPTIRQEREAVQQLLNQMLSLPSQARPENRISEADIEKGVAYFEGKLSTDPVKVNYRPSRKGDFPVIPALSEAEKQHYMKIALESLGRGEGVFTTAAAGAAARMSMKELQKPENAAKFGNLFEMARQIFKGDHEIKSKAAVPIGRDHEGKAYTFLGLMMTNISRLVNGVAKFLPNARKNRVLIMTNNDYQKELDLELSQNDRYGINEDQFVRNAGLLGFQQELGTKYYATPKDTAAMFDKVINDTRKLGDETLAVELERRKPIGVAEAERVEKEFKAGNREAVVYKSEKDPLGHGEFFHQMVSKGILLDLIGEDFDQPLTKWMSFRNIDNAAATFDEDWLVSLGIFIEKGLDMQAEVSLRIKGQKGGGLIITESGNYQLTEDPSFAATVKAVMKELESKGMTRVALDDQLKAQLREQVAQGRPVLLEKTRMMFEEESLSTLEALNALLNLKDDKIAAFRDQSGAMHYYRIVGSDDTYGFNDAVALFSPMYILDIYRKEGQSRREVFEEMKRARQEGTLETIAERGRRKFPSLVDPKPAKENNAIAAVKIETNMWQSTGVVGSDTKIGAVGVYGVGNIDMAAYQQADELTRQALVGPLRMLATKNWDGPAESYESNKKFIDPLIARVTASELFPEALLAARTELRSENREDLLTSDMVQGRSPLSDQVRFSIQSSKQFSDGILRLWLASAIMRLGKQAVAFIGNLLDSPLVMQPAYAAVEMPLLDLPAGTRARVDQGIVSFAAAARPELRAGQTQSVETVAIQALEEGRFVYQGSWLAKLSENPEALFNLLNALNQFEEAGLKSPIVAVSAKKSDFVGAAEKLLTRKDGALSGTERIQDAQMLLSKLKKGLLIHFLEPDSQSQSDVEASIQKYIAAGKGRYGVTVLSSDDRVMIGAVNLNLSLEKVPGQGMSSVLAALPISGALAAQLAKDAKTPDDQQRLLASKLGKIFPGANVAFDGQRFVIDSLGSYIHALFQASVLVARSA